MKILLTFLIVALTALTACTSNNSKSSAEVMATNIIVPPSSEEKEMVVSKSLAPPESSKDYSRKIVKEGEIQFESRDISQSRTALYNSLKKLGGYIAEENQNNNGDSARKEYFLKIKVPADNFDQFLNSVATTAERIDSKKIRIKDVTTYFIDLSAQLINKKALEARYLELLKKGTKIKDLLEIENKVAEIRSDIESTQGSLNYLNTQVAYSSLDITFYIKPKVKTNSYNFGNRIKTALSGGMDALGSFFIGFVSFWPLWILLAVGYFMMKFWKKRSAPKMADQDPA